MLLFLCGIIITLFSFSNVRCAEAAPPTACFTASPNPAGCNQTVTLDASCSSPDTGFSIVAYEWDLDNDGSFDDDTGISVTTSFSAFGTYTVRLRVTDDDSPAQIDTDEVNVVVDQGNVAPVADANGPYIIDVGQSLNLDGTGSSEPDAGCGDSIVSFTWDLNDDGAFGDATGSSPTVSWTELETLGLDLPSGGSGHPISLRVGDSFGTTGTGGTTLRVNGGVIEGTVTFGASTFAGESVEFFDSSGHVGSTTTRADGTFSSPVLPSGGYFVRTANSLGYVDQAYNGVNCPNRSCDPSSGDPVTVVADSTTTGIDFALV